MVPKRHDFDMPKQSIQPRGACVAFGFEISPGLGDYVKVRAQRMPIFSQSAQQFANCTIGLGCGEQDVGIEKNTHADIRLVW